MLKTVNSYFESFFTMISITDYEAKKIFKPETYLSKQLGLYSQNMAKTLVQLALRKTLSGIVFNQK